MCPSEYESGFMLRKPSWHGLENAVLQNSPASWDDARKEAAITWDVETEPVFIGTQPPPELGLPQMVRVADWQAISRNDKPPGDDGRLLAIQKKTYQVIHNSQFGEVIDTVLGLNEDYLSNDDGTAYMDGEEFEFEALMSLYGGRQIVALIKFKQPLKMDWDPSKTYQYLCMITRHDGMGGLRGLATNVRVQCANTLSWAEMTDGKYTGFSIKHTSNWEERLAQVTANITAARGESAKWLKAAEEMANWRVLPSERDIYLKRLLPVSDDMTERKMDNILNARTDIRNILAGPSCEHIANNGYGLLMASTEFNDHHRGYRDADSYVSRQLLHKESFKARAARIVQQMATA